MTLGLGQIKFAGLTMGQPGAYGIYEMTGFRGAADINNADPQRPRNDGAFAAWQFSAKRVITVTGDIVNGNPTGLENDLQAFLTAIVPANNPANVGLLSAYLSNNWFEPRVSNCRVTKAPIIVDNAASLGSYRFAVQFTAPDPIIYTATANSVPASWTSGSLSPAMVCYNTDNYGSGGNAGNATIYPVITVVHVGITSVEVNGTSVMSFTGAPATGTGWVIDCQNKTITDSSGNSQISTLTSGYEWPSIAAGAGGTTIKIAGTPGSATASVAYSAGWITA